MLSRLSVSVATILLTIGAAASISTVSTAADVPPAEAVFERLRQLEGDWKGEFEWIEGRKSKGELRARYEIIGAGSAVVEHLFMSGEDATMSTVYHLDGSELRMTHYCAARNQPRLRAVGFGQSPVAADFGFVDVTGVTKYGHVERAWIEIVDDEHVNIRFQFGGGPPYAGVERITLVRVRPEKPTQPH